MYDNENALQKELVVDHDEEAYRCNPQTPVVRTINSTITHTCVITLIAQHQFPPTIPVICSKVLVCAGKVQDLKTTALWAEIPCFTINNRGNEMVSVILICAQENET